MDSQPYCFVLGRTPELAFLELKTLFPTIVRKTQDIALLSGAPHFSASAVMDLLGGTTKIARIVAHAASLAPDDFASILATNAQNFDFGVSFYGVEGVPHSFSSEVKKSLEARGIRARYVSPQHGSSLSTVSVDKSHITELVVVQDSEGFLIGETVAIQPYEAWNTRDYGRPFSDPKAGMLPPKVARMIVNIARDMEYDDWEPKGKTLLDPFCGMGTVLAEGYMTGWRVMGSDSSAEAVTKAQKNLAWLISTNPGVGGGGGSISVADAAHVSERILPERVDAIVTEPFMGATSIVNHPQVKPEAVKNIIKGLEKLYIGCLREWAKILIPKGLVILALPSYTVLGRTYFVKKVVDMCENLGYTIVVGPIEYSRPQAVVKREFYILKKKQ